MHIITRQQEQPQQKEKNLKQSDVERREKAIKIGHLRCKKRIWS